MTIEFNRSAWFDAVILSACFLGVFYRLYWSGLKSFWQIANVSGFFSALSCKKRWVFRVGLLACGIYIAFFTFFVGVNRTFNAVTIGEELILDYPWPKSDVHVPWAEVVTVSAERKNTKRQSVRLRIDTQQNHFESLWMSSSDSKLLTEAREAIEVKIAEQDRIK